MSEYRKDLLDLEDRGLSKAQNVLSYLFRKILFQTQLSGTRWEFLIGRWMADPRNPAPKNSKDRSSQKGNLNKALKSDRMTWKNCEKGLRFLGVIKLKITAECTWANGKTTAHSVTKELGHPNPEDFDFDLEIDDKLVVTPSASPQKQKPNKLPPIRDIRKRDVAPDEDYRQTMDVVAKALGDIAKMTSDKADQHESSNRSH